MRLGYTIFWDVPVPKTSCFPDWRLSSNLWQLMLIKLYLSQKGSLDMPLCLLELICFHSEEICTLFWWAGDP
jgi:hypothetical protein